MKILERRFVQTEHYWAPPKGGMLLCRELFSFDIPIDVTVCWLSLHTLSTPNRVGIAIESDGVGGVDIIINDSDAGKTEGNTFWDDRLDRYLRKYRGKTLYVQCEYEE